MGCLCDVPESNAHGLPIQNNKRKGSSGDCRRGTVSKAELRFQQYPIPIFSRFEEIEEAHDGALGNVNSIVRTQRKVSASLEFCCTPGWQLRCMTQFLPDHEAVCWADVTHTIRATVKYFADTFAKSLQTMEEARKVVGHTDLAKHSVNSFISFS